MPAEAVTSPRLPHSPPPTSGSVSEALESFQGVQSRALRWALRFLPWLMLLVTTVRLTAFEVGPGNVMYFSGIVAAALSLFAFQVLMQRIPETFRILWDRNTVRARPKRPTDAAHSASVTTEESTPPEEQYRAFIDNVKRWLNDSRQRIMGVIIGLLGAGWIVVDSYRLGGWKALLDPFADPVLIGQFIIEFIIGYIIGLLAWRMIVAGYQIWQMGMKFDLALQLGHPDRCGGLSPIGNLCLWNALIVSTAGVHLGGWIILGPILPEQYSDLAAWYTPLFSTLLLVPLAVAAISFFLPLWSVHQIMVAKRALIQRQLDQLGQSINHLARELLDRADELDPVESEKMARKLERMQQIYRENQHISVWPFNTRILAKFTTSQIVPLLGLTGLGQPVLKAIAGLLDFLNQAQ